MNQGMMWQLRDNKQSIAEAVREAAEYFLAKYNEQATECWVNSADLAGLPPFIGPIKMVGSRSVLRRHIWIGVGETVGINQ
jgi:hypothetical protein